MNSYLSTSYAFFRGAETIRAARRASERLILPTLGAGLMEHLQDNKTRGQVFIRHNFAA